MSDKPSYLNFDKPAYAWKPDIDYREHPELYQVGKGEQGVLICEPYKSEIGQYWRFKSEAIAKESSKQIHELFISYLAANDFVGPIWRGNICKWDLPVRADMPTTRAGKNMIKITIINNWKKELVRTKKLKQRQPFTTVAKLPKPMNYTPV